MYSDYDAATLCAGLYSYPGAPSITWDFLYSGDPCWAIKFWDGYDVIVTRGTTSILDVFDDIDFVPITLGKQYTSLGEVDEGFNDGTSSIVKQVLARNPKAMVRGTGHSLGAARMNLIVSKLRAREFIIDDPVLFGEPPSTMNDPTSARSYRNGFDPVCDLPPMYTKRKNLILLNEPPPDDDEWGPLVGYHHVWLYQKALRS